VLLWGPDFEVDKLKKLDFTASEVVNITTRGLETSYTLYSTKQNVPLGIPAGINV